MFNIEKRIQLAKKSKFVLINYVKSPEKLIYGIQFDEKCLI